MADIAAAAVRVAVGLPLAVERLLLDVVADGFVVCCCGGRVEPTALVAFYEWEHCIDLITIRGFDRITTARLPKHGKTMLAASPPTRATPVDDPTSFTRPCSRPSCPAGSRDGEVRATAGATESGLRAGHARPAW